jgi:hypothetical protein
VQIILPSKISTIFTALFFICSSIFFGIISLGFPAGGELFPLFLFGSIIFLSFLLILEILLKNNVQKPIAIKLDFFTWKPFFVSIAVIVHVIFIFILGYFTSSFLFLVGCSILIGLRDARAIGITAVILFPLMYAFFEIFLKASLPSGILF